MIVYGSLNYFCPFHNSSPLIPTHLVPVCSAGGVVVVNTSLVVGGAGVGESAGIVIAVGTSTDVRSCSLGVMDVVGLLLFSLPDSLGVLGSLTDCKASALS